MEIKRGKAFKFGDGISTDHIAPGRLFHLRSNLEEFSKHMFWRMLTLNLQAKCKKAILLLQEIILD